MSLKPKSLIKSPVRAWEEMNDEASKLLSMASPARETMAASVMAKRITEARRVLNSFPFSTSE